MHFAQYSLQKNLKIAVISPPVDAIMNIFPLSFSFELILRCLRISHSTYSVLLFYHYIAAIRPWNM